MTIGLIIVGDEILSGRREDKHLRKVIEILAARGLPLDWAEYVGDEPQRITALLARTFASGDIVFSTGGIGATPDDHTRQCAAAALGVPLERHAQAQALIAERIVEMAGGDASKVDLNGPDSQQRYKMADFPQGAAIIPNPYNKIAGFSVGHHHFVPGFPVMAWPMIEWVLDTHYAHLFHRQPHREQSFLVFEAPEAALTPLMETVERMHPGIKVFSLPSVGDAERGTIYVRRHIDLGVKGAPDLVQPAYAALKAGVVAAGYEVMEIDAE